jgi:CHRD domain
MSKRLTRAILALAMVAGLTIGVAAMAGAQGRNNEFRATMKGSSETPKGPATASGTFTVEFRNGRACYRMSVRGLGAFPVAAHIHKAAAGTNGPIVIDLKATARSTWKGTSPRVAQKCVSAKASVVSAIRRNPAGYYANVHTPKNPGGAARGQLRADTRGGNNEAGDDNGGGNGG